MSRRNRRRRPSPSSSGSSWVLWTNVAVLALGLVMLLFARGPIADVASGFFAGMTDSADDETTRDEPDVGRAEPRDREASIQIIPARATDAVSPAVDAARLRVTAAAHVAHALVVDTAVLSGSGAEAP